MNVTYYVVVTFYIVSLLQNVTIIKRNPPVENQNCLLVQRRNDNIALGAFGREDLSLFPTRELKLDTQSSDISAGILALPFPPFGASRFGSYLVGKPKDRFQRGNTCSFSTIGIIKCIGKDKGGIPF